MSLRVRVVALFGLVLFISVLMGALFAGLEAKRNLGEEMGSALSVARQSVSGAFEDLPHSDHPERDLRQLIATFDGNRHVQAALIDPNGVTLAASSALKSGDAAPPWFGGLLGASAAPTSIPVPTPGRKFGTVRLTPVAAADVAALWREFAGIIVVVLASALAGLVLVYILIGAALRPLQSLADEFIHIGAGDYGGRMPAAGPTELIRLQTGFNSMVERLASMTERNRQLTDQLLTLQDEERADIARDLHDEIGPHLFAANMDAEMIAQWSLAQGDERLVRQARSIQAGVGHMQRLVRELLLRLRPTPATELGFRAALEDLVRFWAARRPDVAFRLDVLEDEDALKEPVKDLAYRVIQEAVNNAIRHGAPGTVEIAVQPASGGDLVISVRDDGAEGGSPAPGGGFGLLGMRERVAASGGRLEFGPRRERGWAVTARVPLRLEEGRVPKETAA